MKAVMPGRAFWMISILCHVVRTLQGAAVRHCGSSSATCGSATKVQEIVKPAC
jgi:hypothetical protein